jgi:hypothetical protein
MYCFSYLISYRETDESRRNSLQYILKQLCLEPSLEVILVEQDAISRFKGEHQTNFKHVFVENSGPFNKSWGLNIAASHASCHRLIFADSDMLIAATALDDTSKEMDNGVDAVNPYDVLVDLSQQESQQLLAQINSVKISRTTAQVNRQIIGQDPPFCGGVFAITRALYDSSGGMDERFEGWGGEDDAMSKRVAFFANKTATLSGIAYHLWHETKELTGDNSSGYIRNLALLSMYYEHQQPFYRLLAQRDATQKASSSKYRMVSESSIFDQQDPLISCLCVTRGRVSMLARAIDCFQAQSYSNKELLVICEDDDTETQAFLNALKVTEIRHHIEPVEPKTSLGGLRNLSIQLAKGDFICQWDDDDWYHPERLASQFKSAMTQNKPASVLPRWLIHQRRTDRMYCSNIRLWEGSLLCRKDILPKEGAYDRKHKGEDSKLVEWLFIEDQLAIQDFPDLYVYCLSGENTWDHAHFDEIIEVSSELGPKDAAIIKDRINMHCHIEPEQ